MEISKFRRSKYRCHHLAKSVPFVLSKGPLSTIVGTEDAKPNEDYLLFTNIKVLVKPFHSMQLPKAKKTFC